MAETTTDTWASLSPEAAKRSSRWASATQLDHAAMLAGPQIDGNTVIVPSRWYSEEAASFWKLHGFRWNPARRQWERGTRRPHNGKQYSADCWLKSTRREFYEFWPTLLKDCIHCHERFLPASTYQLMCPQCYRELNTPPQQILYKEETSV